MNGEVVAQGSQFSLRDSEVVLGQVDLDAVCYTSALLENNSIYGLLKNFTREHFLIYACQLICFVYKISQHFRTSNIARLSCFMFEAVGSDAFCLWLDGRLLV